MKYQIDAEGELMYTFPKAAFYFDWNKFEIPIRPPELQVGKKCAQYRPQSFSADFAILDILQFVASREFIFAE